VIPVPVYGRTNVLVAPVTRVFEIIVWTVAPALCLASIVMLMVITEPATTSPCGDLAVTVKVWSPIAPSEPPTESEPAAVRVTN